MFEKTCISLLDTIYLVTLLCPNQLYSILLYISFQFFFGTHGQVDYTAQSKHQCETMEEIIRKEEPAFVSNF